MTHLLDTASPRSGAVIWELLPLIYDELRKLARARMAKVPAGATLQPTALVHEVYLRLVNKHHQQLSDSRRYFFAAAAQVMREVLIDQARRKASQKRGGDRQRIEFDEAQPVFELPSLDMLALDEALDQLERDDPRAFEIVQLRFFAGLKVEQVAQLMGLSVPTIEREWRFARTLLYARLASTETSHEG